MWGRPSFLLNPALGSPLFCSPGVRTEVHGSVPRGRRAGEASPSSDKSLEGPRWETRRPARRRRGSPWGEGPERNPSLPAPAGVLPVTGKVRQGASTVVVRALFIHTTAEESAGDRPLSGLAVAGTEVPGLDSSSSLRRRAAIGTLTEIRNQRSYTHYNMGGMSR